MAVRNCPECGHELSGIGRFCQFCGCDLRKAPRPAASAGGTRPPEAGTWDPADPYRPAPGRTLFRILALIFLIAAGIIAAVYFSVRTESGPHPQLRGGMSFLEAAAEMERCGFVKEGNPTTNAGTVTQAYKKRAVYGQRADAVGLEVAEGRNGSVGLIAYYIDSAGKTGGESALLRKLKKAMTTRWGDPEYIEAMYNYYRWADADGEHLLAFSEDVIMVYDRYPK